MRDVANTQWIPASSRPRIPVWFVVVSVFMSSIGCGDHKALTPMAPAPNGNPSIRSITVNPTPVGAGLSAQVSAEAEDPDGDELRYLWSATAGRFSGDGPNVTWQAPDQPGSQELTLEVRDGRDGREIRALTLVVIARDPSNMNPTIDLLTAQPDSVSIRAVSIFQVEASDPDGDSLHYSWSRTGGTLDGSGPRVTWTAPVAAGTYLVSVSVTDGRGGSDGRSIPITVYSDNNAPVVANVSADRVELRLAESISLTAAASDPDEDPLSYSWSSFGGVFSGEGPRVTWTAPSGPPCCAVGEYALDVEVDDGNGGAAEGSVVVVVTI